MTRIELDLLATRQKVEILTLQRAFDERGDAFKRVCVERDAALSSLAIETRKNEAAEESLTRVREQRDAMDADRRAAKKERDETLAQFDELKARLFASEAECNRLRGYVERVQDRDRAQDGVVLAGETARGEAPARGDCDYAAQRPHWTGYGQRR